MEVSDVSGALLFDVKRGGWLEEVLSALDIPTEFLPDSYESPEVTGRITRRAPEEMDLSSLGGGGDQVAGAVGNRIVELGIIWSIICTSVFPLLLMTDLNTTP